MIRRGLVAALTPHVLLLGAACSGEIVPAGDTSAPRPSTPSMPLPGGTSVPQTAAEGSTPYVPAAPSPAAMPARVWRLSHAEYRAAVADFVSEPVDTSEFAAEDDSGVFANVSNVGFVRTDLAGNYQRAAEQVAGKLTQAQLLPLTGVCGSVTAACKADFLSTAARRGFRRPATAEELTELAGTFELALGSGDALFPFQAVVQQILTSPMFLYKTEVGSPADIAKPSFRITPHEAASLLSFSVLGQPPSAELLAAADRGELSNVPALRSRVEALLDTPAAEAPLQAFLGQWFSLKRLQSETEVHKFPEMFPGFEAARPAILAEAKGFLSTHGGMRSTLKQLLTAPVPAATGALATFYSTPGAGPGTRTGVLGLGAFLATAAHSDIGSPTLRGLFVRERLLCQHFVVPPNVPNLADVEGMGVVPKSTRDLYQLHKVRPDCAACHDSIDPVGFVFEDFDGAGRFRKQELFRNQTTPVAVDTSGRLTNTDVNQDLVNHTQLASALASSAWVRECVATQAFRFYMGVGGEVPRGLPPVTSGFQALSSGAAMRELIAAVVASESTIERTRQ